MVTRLLGNAVIASQQQCQQQYFSATVVVSWYFGCFQWCGDWLQFCFTAQFCRDVSSQIACHDETADQRRWLPTTEMTVYSTMSYQSTYRNSYTPQSTYRPYRSTYGTDYSPRSTGTSSLYKTSTFISPPSRSSGYTSTSRTLPTIGRSTNTVSYDRGLSSRTLPLRASSTQSYETSRSNYAPSYTRRDSDRFSVVRSGTVDYSSSSAESVNQSTRNNNASRDTESVNTRYGCNGNDRVANKQLGGNPEASLQDRDSEPKSDNHHARRSPSVDRVSKEMSTMARAKRYQSVDRIGAAQLSPVVCIKKCLMFVLYYCINGTEEKNVG